MMTDSSVRRDVIVIGASAGGVETLTRLVAGLPADLPAALFVVLHMSPHAPSALASILTRAGSLPAHQAEDGESIETGAIYVARPNRHLVVQRGKVVLQAGPRENSARPAVDVLFRSASRAYGPRVIGIVLSGTLHDGALGLAAVRMRGGVTLVQDPEEALFPGMPTSALSTGHVDYRLRVGDMPARLVELTSHTIRVPMEPTARKLVEHEHHAADEPNGGASPKRPNAASGLTCPECHGSLWELTDGNGSRYECRVGHTYSLDALLAEQGEAVEAALWSAVNSLQERAAAFRRLAAAGLHASQINFEERAEATERHAGALLALLGGLIAEGEVG